jgi:hypothetical protein
MPTPFPSTDLSLMLADWGQAALLVAILEASPSGPTSDTPLTTSESFPLVVIRGETLDPSTARSSPQGTLSTSLREARFVVATSSWPLTPAGALLELHVDDEVWVVTHVVPQPHTGCLILSAHALAPA